MPQITMLQSPLQAVEGMLANSIHEQEIVTRIASGQIPVGKAVTPYADSEVGPNSQRSKLPTSAAEAAKCEGVAVFSESLPQTDTENYAYYATQRPMGVCKKGEIWVVSGNQITDLNKPVLVRHANGNLTQVFVLTIQAGSATDKVYTFKVQAPNGAITTITHTAVDDDEDLVATAVASQIDAISGIGASATGPVVTCTADNADELWKVLELVVADIVLTGETTPTAGTLGSFRSTMDAVQVHTLSLADTAATGKPYTFTFKSNLGRFFQFTYLSTGAVEATEATAIAAIIDADTDLAAAAVDEVITVTAANLDEFWEISANADVAVAETTSTNYARWIKEDGTPAAEWVASMTNGSVWFGKLRVNN